MKNKSNMIIHKETESRQNPSSLLYKNTQQIRNKREPPKLVKYIYLKKPIANIIILNGKRLNTSPLNKKRGLLPFLFKRGLEVLAWAIRQEKANASIL